MRTELIKFLREKREQGLPMMIGEGMSELDITVGPEMPREVQEMNVFRAAWENNNK